MSDETSADRVGTQYATLGKLVHTRDSGRGAETGGRNGGRKRTGKAKHGYRKNRRLRGALPTVFLRLQYQHAYLIGIEFCNSPLHE